METPSGHPLGVQALPAAALLTTAATHRVHLIL